MSSSRAGVWSIVVAAGVGTRFGGLKQVELLGSQRVIDWSVDAVAEVSDGVVVVTTAALVDQLQAVPGVTHCVVGGASRSDSVRAGLAQVPDNAEVVVVHDAARPMAGGSLTAEVVAAVRNGADAAVPVVPVVDTIKQVAADDAGKVLSTLDRGCLVAAQTPQAFRATALRNAHRLKVEATDDAALVEINGGVVRCVPGLAHNTKITTWRDLVLARMTLQEQSEAGD